MATNHLADQQLVRNYLQGNDHSFEVLLKRHQDRVKGRDQIVNLVERDEASCANVGRGSRCWQPPEVLGRNHKLMVNAGA